MLLEYALDPSLLGTWAELRFYVAQFGVSKGRLISEYPIDWKAMVRDEAKKKAKDREFLRIIEMLTRLDEKMLPRDGVFDDAKSWFKNAIDENRRAPFHAIVTTTRSGATQNLINGLELDPTDPPKLWDAPTSVNVRRIAADMAACVGRLLSIATEIVFIDPYFSPRATKTIDPLKAFLAAMAQRTSRQNMPTKLEFHAGNQDVGSDYQSLLDMKVKPCLPSGVSMRVIRWNKAELHNRYIITDRGGVMFGWGLGQDSSVANSHDTVSLLDEKTCSEILQDYSPQTQKYTWLNDIVTIVN